jgi:lysophospholipase L1-like esterase
MKPFKTLFFTLGVFLLLAGAMWLTPDEGVKVGEFTFHMPTFEEMLLTDKVEYADVSELIEHQFDIDSLVDLGSEAAFSDSVTERIARASYDSLVQSIFKIELTDSGRTNLSRFFKTLHEGKPIRIMHYGDSQIEGDRMTSFIRSKLQTKFGGTGPGLRPALQPYDFLFSAVQVNSPNWQRFPIYGNVDARVEHDRYGVMGAFSRFAPPASDSIPFTDSVLYEAELSVAKTDISYKQTQVYDHFRLFYGNAKRPVFMQLSANGNVCFSDTLKPNLDYGLVQYDLPDSTSNISLKFAGWDSPDIYAIDLASKNGVVVDNIALRGSSGTIFTKNNFAHSLKMYRDLKPDLFILQFGGNVMPYIKDQKAIDDYGRWFKSQIVRLKKLCPNAAVIVIGPSDMSTKIKDKYVTYELLPNVVEALKEATLSTGSGFWNMYEAMGGHNSMPSWVNADPQLAGPDYVHFTTRGARLIGNMFYNALIYEYNKTLNDPV